MTHTLLLDIDGVLLPHGEKPTKKTTGFDDWRKVDRRFFTYVSADQLALIQKLFPRVIWLTTWEIGFAEGGGANDEFCPHAGWDIVHETIPFIGEFHNAHYRWDAPQWWKARIVERILLDHNELLPGKVVWADDDLAERREGPDSRRMLRESGALDRFRIEAPELVWTKKAIIEAGEWAK